MRSRICFQLWAPLLKARGLLNFRVTGHYDVIKDQILFVTQGFTSARRQNIGEGRSIGTDIELRSRLDDLLYMTVDTRSWIPSSPVSRAIRSVGACVFLVFIGTKSLTHSPSAGRISRN